MGDHEQSEQSTPPSAGTTIGRDQVNVNNSPGAIVGMVSGNVTRNFGQQHITNTGGAPYIANYYHDGDVPLPLDSARRERACRWAHTDLRGYPTLSAEEETEATLAVEPKESQVRKGKPHDPLWVRSSRTAPDALIVRVVVSASAAGPARLVASSEDDDCAVAARRAVWRTRSTWRSCGRGSRRGMRGGRGALMCGLTSTGRTS